MSQVRILSPRPAADRLRVALDLDELSERLERARLRRQHPRANEATRRSRKI